MNNTAKHIAVITLFPEMFSALTESGISRRAVEKGLITLKCFNPRAYTTDRHQTVDDRPYGGGPGMVMRVEPLARAVEDAQNWLQKVSGSQHKAKVIYMSPQGRLLDNSGVQEFGDRQQMIIVAGRYEGIDERFIERYIDEEWSIGDYVLSGGELPAMVLLDAVIRRIPGALGDAQSAEQDSFEEGLLDCPHYTRPEVWSDGVKDFKVPDVLLSGDHGKISQWRRQQSLGRTFNRRPDLLQDTELDHGQLELLSKYQVEQTKN